MDIYTTLIVISILAYVAIGKHAGRATQSPIDFGPQRGIEPYRSGVMCKNSTDLIRCDDSFRFGAINVAFGSA